MTVVANQPQIQGVLVNSRQNEAISEILELVERTWTAARAFEGPFRRFEIRRQSQLATCGGQQIRWPMSRPHPRLSVATAGATDARPESDVASAAVDVRVSSALSFLAAKWPAIASPLACKLVVVVRAGGWFQ